MVSRWANKAAGCFPQPTWQRIDLERHAGLRLGHEPLSYHAPGDSLARPAR